VLIVEQFIHLALKNTHRAYVLAKGEVVLEGSSSELGSDPQVVEAYLGG
jgi:branched-chain amino acid transport system ATP-binding protein